MTSRIDRAFIRAFAKQRGESTPAAESFAPKSVAPIKAAPAQAAPDEAQPEEAALKSPSRVTHRVDESADTPAKPAGIAWQEMPATVNTAVNVEARGLEDMNALEVLSIGEVFPTELFEGRIDNGVPNIPNIEEI